MDLRIEMLKIQIRDLIYHRANGTKDVWGVWGFPPLWEINERYGENGRRFWYSVKKLMIAHDFPLLRVSAAC